MTTLLPVDSDSRLIRLCDLAELIWNEYFPSIIGQAQVDYMLARFQSREAIEAQIAAGYRYFLIQPAGAPLGYAAFRDDFDDASRFLSKLYIRGDMRGRGIASQVLGEILGEAREAGLETLWLTVNRHNRLAIDVYQTLGLRITGELVTDIGAGFVMDDYRMEMDIDD